MCIKIQIGSCNWNYTVTENQSVYPSSADSNSTVLNLSTDEDVATLLARRKGTTFVVRQGHLKVIQSLWERIKYWFNKSREQACVKQCIAKTIRQLEQDVTQFEKSTLDAAAKKTQKVALTELLCTRFLKHRDGALARLSKAVYQISNIEYGSTLESYLNPERTQTLDNFQKILKTHKSDPKKNRPSLLDSLHQVLTTEAIFSQQLGRDFEPISKGGSGGAKFGLSRTDQPLVVIKGGDEGPYGKNTPSRIGRLKQVILSPRSCLRGNSEPVAERASYRLSQTLSLFNVPPTAINTVKGNFVGPKEKEASIQLFVDHARSLRKQQKITPFWDCLPYSLRHIFRNYLHRHPPPVLPQESLEYAAILKYCSGDIDTHFDNMLYKKRSSAEQEHAFLNRYFSGQASDEEIDHFCRNLFKNENHYHLLDRLLWPTTEHPSEAMIINHDGGASFPNRHPSSAFTLDSYLSTRFCSQFEVLPSFDNAFLPCVRDLLLDRQKEFADFVLEHAILELIGVTCHRGNVSVFTSFWNDATKRHSFKNLILHSIYDDALNKDLSAFLASCQSNPKRKGAAFFEKELKRIRGVCQSFIERGRLLFNHLTYAPQAAMRDLFGLVHEKNIREKLTVIQQQSKRSAFDDRLDDLLVARTPSTQIELPDNYHALQTNAAQLVSQLYDN